MAKKLPLKWFPSDWTAQIKQRKVDKWAEIHAKSGLSPYFDTWDEAYAYMMGKATKRADRAKKDLASAERHLTKVKAMVKPPFILDKRLSGDDFEDFMKEQKAQETKSA